MTCGVKNGLINTLIPWLISCICIAYWVLYSIITEHYIYVADFHHFMETEVVTAYYSHAHMTLPHRRRRRQHQNIAPSALSLEIVKGNFGTTTLLYHALWPITVH